MVYKYQFSKDGVVQQAYSTFSSWAMSAATPIGTYVIDVAAKASPSDPGVSSSMTYTVVSPSAPIVPLYRRPSGHLYRADRDGDHVHLDEYAGNYLLHH